MSSPLLDLPLTERPRERLLAHGSRFLSDRDLLAVVLRSGTRSRNAIDVGGVLLDEVGGLLSLSTASVDELMRVSGIGAAKAAAVVASFELGRRAAVAPAPMAVMSAADIAIAALPLLQGLRRERVVLLICDSGNRLRRTTVVSDGATDGSLLPVRDVLNLVLRVDGSAFALAHNHPSGSPLPSQQDILVTARLQAAAELVGLRFLDHVIVSDTQWSRVGSDVCSPLDVRSPLDAHENAV